MLMSRSVFSVLPSPEYFLDRLKRSVKAVRLPWPQRTAVVLFSFPSSEMIAHLADALHAGLEN